MSRRDYTYALGADDCVTLRPGHASPKGGFLDRQIPILLRLKENLEELGSHQEHMQPNSPAGARRYETPHFLACLLWFLTYCLSCLSCLSFPRPSSTRTLVNEPMLPSAIECRVTTLIADALDEVKEAQAFALDQAMNQAGRSEYLRGRSPPTPFAT